MSALHHLADSSRTSRHFRKVPATDSCTAHIRYPQGPHDVTCRVEHRWRQGLAAGLSIGMPRARHIRYVSSARNSGEP